MNPNTEHSLRSTDHNPFGRDMTKDPKEGDAQEMKGICQLLHLGLSTIMDEMEKGDFNVKEALFRLKYKAQVGAYKIYPGNSLADLAAFNRNILADLKLPKPKKVFGILSGKRIDGDFSVKPSEDFGGNVGPVVEPGAAEMTERIAHTEAVVDAVIGQLRFTDLQEVRS